MVDALHGHVRRYVDGKQIVQEFDWENFGVCQADLNFIHDVQLHRKTIHAYVLYHSSGMI